MICELIISFSWVACLFKNSSRLKVQCAVCSEWGVSVCKKLAADETKVQGAKEVGVLIINLRCLALACLDRKSLLPLVLAVTVNTLGSKWIKLLLSFGFRVGTSTLLSSVTLWPISSFPPTLGKKRKKEKKIKKNKKEKRKKKKATKE